MPTDPSTSRRPGTIRPTWRIYFATGAVLGLLLGVNAAVVDITMESIGGAVDPGDARWRLVYFIFGPLLGMLAGLLVTPFVVWFVVQKDVRWVAPLLLAGAVLTDLACSWAMAGVRENWGPVFHLVVDVVAVALLAWLGGRILPDVFGPFAKGTCVRCGYDLTGVRGRTCPECGKIIERGPLSLEGVEKSDNV